MQSNLLMCMMILLLGFTSSCQDNLSPDSPEAEALGVLEGAWISPEYSEDGSCYEWTRNLPDDAYGFDLLEGGELIVNQNSGWCGTPPIHYERVEGTWTLEDDVLTLEYPYWGGMIEAIYTITSTAEDRLCLGEIEVNYN
ncbi:hypothetical protein [Pontibacter sp. G13]|uniref:hypothetical protein n=1 Tax=Pontibacter sp. G13 TaxID=3074898 RepID=UPI00288B29D8|nr:hypothetical protein [Pontibacter sp. G13]WNJ20064.1 hypothetical protein RJD25_06230 [Pontibacter sp. G13]